MVSTAADMARFMIAHLQNGHCGNAVLLREETISEMHDHQFTIQPGKSGVTYGFAEGFVNGERLIGHSGAIRGFGSILDLLPEHNLGYFFSFNEECYQTSACDIVPTFRKEFMNYLFPSYRRVP